MQRAPGLPIGRNRSTTAPAPARRPSLRWRVLAGAACLALLAMLAGAGRAAAAPAWLTPASLSTPGQDAFGLRVATDARGNAAATWYRFDGVDTRVQAAYRQAGGTWSAPTSLSAPGQSASAPAVAVHDDTVVVLWTRSDGNIDRVQASVRRATTGAWSQPVTLSSAGSIAIEPQVAVDPAGNAVAVWRGTQGAEIRVESSTRDGSTGSWSPAAFVSAPGQAVSEPQIAIDPSGTAVVVWEAFDGASFRARASHRSAAGAWQGEQYLSPPANEDVDAPQVAVDRAGNATALWSRSDGVVQRVESASYRAGAWSSPVYLSGAGQDAATPQVAVDAAGTAVAAWQRSDGANQRVEVRSRPAGGAWAPVDLVSGAGQDAFAPHVAASDGGVFGVVWSRSDGANGRAEARIGAPGALGPVTLLSSAGQTALAPRIAFDGTGSAVAVWRHGPTMARVAQAAAYDASGPALVVPTQPATAAVGTPLTLSATSVDTWSQAVGQPRWSFGDGSADVEATSVTHTYRGPGTYLVSVSQADALGNTSTLGWTVVVSAGQAAASSIVRPAVRIAAASVNRRRGVIRLRVACPAGVAGTCTGRLVVQTARKVPFRRLRHAGSSRRRVVGLGRARVSIASGRRATVAVRLSRRNRVLLRRLGAVKVRVQVRTTDGAGNRATSKRVLKLRSGHGR